MQRSIAFMKTGKLVSIGMPVYNSAPHIRQALDSMLAQDYEHLELIISDNASTDGTQEICLAYAAKDQRIRYYRNVRNMGMLWNKNRLFELASGEYFKWAGSYDCLAPTFISACKRVLDDDPRVVLAYPLSRLIDENGAFYGEVVREILDTRKLPTSARVVTAIAKTDKCAHEFYGLFRTSALRRCRPLCTLLGDDHLLMMEISFLGAIAVVPEVLFYRRESGPVLPEDERIATTLIRQSPEARTRKRIRPCWELWRQHLTGAWRLASLKKKLYLVPLVAYTFYSRWHGQLKRELRHPYSLRGRKELGY